MPPCASTPSLRASHWISPAGRRVRRARPGAGEPPRGPPAGRSRGLAREARAPRPTKLAQARDDVPLPLTKLLGRRSPRCRRSSASTLGKGMVRDSCVRFVPERVFFTCKYAQQRYADKTDNFAAVRSAYEDGVATEVAYDGWKHGSGAFTPEALLAGVGLVLPEPGAAAAPADGVKLWRGSTRRRGC
jgi:hypothetical protein